MKIFDKNRGKELERIKYNVPHKKYINNKSFLGKKTNPILTYAYTYYRRIDRYGWGFIKYGKDEGFLKCRRFLTIKDSTFTLYFYCENSENIEFLCYLCFEDKEVIIPVKKYTGQFDIIPKWLDDNKNAIIEDIDKFLLLRKAATEKLFSFESWLGLVQFFNTRMTNKETEGIEKKLFTTGVKSLWNFYKIYWVWRTQKYTPLKAFNFIKSFSYFCKYFL